MKLDTSAAPELALLTVPAIATAAGTAMPGGGDPGAGSPDTGSAGGGLPGAGLGGGSSGGGWPGADLGGGASGAGSSDGGAPGTGTAAAAAGPASPAGPVTIGYLAACLRFLVSDPGRWWDLVRFDPQRPLIIPVTAPAPGCETWLLVLPPGHHGEAAGQAPSGGVSWLVAGGVTEQAAAAGRWQGRPLAPGRTMVHGGHGPSRLVNSGAGYAVTLHARPLPG